MRREIIWSVIVVVQLVFTARAVGAGPATRASNEELIDGLVRVTEDQFSVKTNIFAVGPGTVMPRGTRMMQDGESAPGAEMVELARRGLDALPDLAKHLDDARKTRVTV